MAAAEPYLMGSKRVRKASRKSFKASLTVFFLLNGSHSLNDEMFSNKKCLKRHWIREALCCFFKR